MIVVAKIGTSSITDARGVDRRAGDRARSSPGSPALRADRAPGRRRHVGRGRRRPARPGVRAATAGPATPARSRPSRRSGRAASWRSTTGRFAAHDLVAGQVLLAPLDFGVRSQYLHARGTLRRLLELGVVPVINENDAIADDEIRFGDNDRLAALVAHLLEADLLVLLTDTAGPADRRPAPRPVGVAHRGDRPGRPRPRGPRRRRRHRQRGSGGMASKVAAAKMAAWSGVRTVIASSTRDRVLATPSTACPASARSCCRGRSGSAARKLWIAFAVPAEGVVRVDDGARRALIERNVSLLPAGVVGVEGRFEADDAVELAGPDGVPFAKGLVRVAAASLTGIAGRRTADLPEGTPHEVVHRDDLVVLP